MIKQVDELSLERAKALLGREKEEISEERLKKVVEQVKAFCKVAYRLYSKTNNSATDLKGDNVRQLYCEPPDEFTNAA
ncbi:MAG: hypothetical protein JNJ40_10260 [Bacteroidia bacterium]|nr:hypothetical protein [Bacteroidia bacterium]